MLVSFDCCIEQAQGRQMHEAEPSMTSCDSYGHARHRVLSVFQSVFTDAHLAGCKWIHGAEPAMFACQMFDAMHECVDPATIN